MTDTEVCVLAEGMVQVLTGIGHTPFPDTPPAPLPPSMAHSHLEG